MTPQEAKNLTLEERVARLEDMMIKLDRLIYKLWKRYYEQKENETDSSQPDQK